MPDTLKGVTNFWIRKRKEAELLRIVSWAQYYEIRIEDLTNDDIQEALRMFRYTNTSSQSSHDEHSDL